MASYSTTDKLLHKTYLSNYFLSLAGLELEELLYGKKADNIEVRQQLFVTGLARSGTTAVMNKLFETGSFASLQYSNMPFLLNVNTWNRSSSIAPHERAHKDGIIVDGNSPEEFDEYFWKAVLNDSYINENHLLLNEIDDKTLDKYQRYIRLVCFAKGKNKYISKNNNNVLRLNALQKLNNAKIFILFRKPMNHAGSLLKLHLRFSKEQQQDSFVLDYFDYLGHHEFGLHHKPFLLNEALLAELVNYDKESIEYWMLIWLNYYSYVMENLRDDYELICFEDLIADPEAVHNYIFGLVRESYTADSTTMHKPSTYHESTENTDLEEKCNTIYNDLLAKRRYS